MASKLINYHAISSTDSNHKTPYIFPAGLQDVHMILWAGDCIHAIPDVQRLSCTFEQGVCVVYVCYGYKEVAENLSVLPENAYICTLNMEDTLQKGQFLCDFANRCKIITSDYNGSTPSIPLSDYTHLLVKGGLAYNTEGVSGGFNPVDVTISVLELFAPILPPELKEKRIWIPEILNLAKWNEFAPSVVYTSPDLKGGVYNSIWKKQVAYFEDLQRVNPGFSQALTHTDETLEEYWKKLPDTILRGKLGYAFHSYMQESQREHISKYFERFSVFLWKYIQEKIETFARNPLADEVEPFLKNQTDLFTKIQHLQKIIRLLNLCKTCEPTLTPYISVYMDSRYSPSQETCNLWFTKI